MTKTKIILLKFYVNVYKMKNSMKTKDITIIAAVLILSITATIYGWNKIGVSPQIPENLLTKENVDAGNDSNTLLSFPKSGRIGSVLVKNGDKVVRGQILAKLYAPDAEGAVNQAKGALDLAQAQYASLNKQYSTAKSQQDTLVQNAYRTLLSSGLQAEPSTQEKNSFIISGTYSCDKEGSYNMTIEPTTGGDTGYAVFFNGIEKGSTPLQYDNPAPLGNCGLQIKFVKINGINSLTKWVISIPNTKSASYVTNKNAYDLAISTRDKVLSDIAANIGNGETNSVASAQIEAARGAYEAASGAYQNNLITAPTDGVISYVDKDLKEGQNISANKIVIHISKE